MEHGERRFKGSNLTWAQPLRVLEVKLWDSAFVDVWSRMQRLKVNVKPTTVSYNLTHLGLVRRRLYVHARILHRDLSLNNAMYRIAKEKNEVGITEEKICRVLVDFVAHGSLDGSDSLRMYRHDLETLLHYADLITL